MAVWRTRLAIMLAVGWLGADRAAAQSPPSTASGSIGGGMIGQEPAAHVAATVDLSGWGALVGLGMRLRFVDQELVRQDWDERSDMGRALRYFLWARDFDGEAAVSIAAGQLAGVELGHGSIVSGYAAGVDFDRGRTGLEVRGRRGVASAHLVIDDVLDPAIVAARAARPVSGPLELGVSGAVDFATAGAIVFVGADAALGIRRDKTTAAVTLEGVGVLDEGAGVHLGVRGATTTAGVHVAVRAEVRAGTDGYIPSWIGPLYVRDRIQAGDSMESGTQLERARRASLRGASWAGSIAASHKRVGSVAASVATRPSLPTLATLRLHAPSFRRFQVGLWAALEVRNGAALAAEARARLGRRLFVSAELARHYTGGEAAMELAPLWVAAISVGATLGESP